MIYSVHGIVVHIEQNLAVVECAGVGYGCRTTAYTLSGLTVGKEATLLTLLNIREDAAELFGFGDEAELNCFKMLLSVNGVGPKAALSILSDLSPQGFALSVAGGDSKALTRAPGIGKKIADRIILELKDKLAKQAEGATALPYSDTGAVPTASNAVSEAIAALVVLGFSNSEAQKAVARLSPELPVSELVKEALKSLSARA
ncbi:MAG: Holliday junction branch migration protein RuvA [Bacteroides sp.]|nr:Holliday junction branch migration protein RuvA [Eubacterium sp.]MCM1418071.1 Holliday junction branch migration protein RuvA [Roseburia sp.]MCM1462215.1 Holliday junction branch migration protein RuvA [Bacteroides sp.]